MIIIGNPVNWFEIYIADMEKAKTFYNAVLGKELTELPSPYEGEMYEFPMEENSANASGALVKHSQGQPGMGSTMVYFQR